MLSQFFKFSLVGVANTVIHYGVFYLLYSVWGLYHLLASALGFIVAVTHSYILNKFWTFKRRGSPVSREFSKFVLINILSLTVNLTGMAVLVESFQVNPLLAQLVTIAITMVINFLGNKFWTFGPQTKQQ
ncbi:MAG: GtrA family protein [Desulfobulbaceae bacterium]|nr:GtrA family protein [Desulfobulbaceae bacterium]